MRTILSKQAGITLEQQYIRGRSLAATLHVKMPDIHGIRYSSVQVNSLPMTCIMLFGDRTEGMDFGPAEELELLDGEGLTYLHETATVRGFILSEPLAQRMNLSG